MSHRPKILFVTYGGGHVSMVIPVVKHLVAHQLAEPVVIALTTAGDACRREGIEFLSFKDFMPPDEPEVRRLGERLIEGQETHPTIDHEESVAYHGMSYRDLIDRVGEAEAAEAFERNGRGAFLPVGVLERAIRGIAPDLVVATNSPRAERAALEAARRLGIATCCLVDVFGVRSDWIMRPGFVDRICVLSERVRQIFVSRGQDPDVIEITGNPGFDTLAAVRERRRARNHRPDEYRVLWAPHPEPEVSPIDSTKRGDQHLNSRLASELANCATRHPDWSVVVRPHPSQRDFHVDGPANLLVFSGDELEDRLVWADTVVTCASTVGLQASLVEIPTVAVAGSVVEDYVPLVEYGLAHGVELEALDQLLGSLRDDPVSLDSGLPEIGHATERVAAALLALVSDPPS